MGRTFVFEWPLIFGTLALLSCALFLMALARGAAPERILSGTLLTSALIGWVVRSVQLPVPGDALPLLHIVVSMAALSVILPVAICANRFYPIAIGGAQLAKIICHAWCLRLGQDAASVHVLIDGSVSILQLMLSAGGLVSHVRRLPRLGGDYPSWTRSHYGPIERSDTFSPVC